jgi:hypothetical protein
MTFETSSFAPTPNAATVYQSSQKHVAADAGEAFEVRNAHKKDRVFIIGKPSKPVKRLPVADSVKISVSSMV